MGERERREKWRKLAEEASERSKRFIVFKPEIERTRWKKGKEEEGRKEEKAVGSEEGEMVFEKEQQQQPRESEIKGEGDTRGGGGSRACGVLQGELGPVNKGGGKVGLRSDSYSHGRKLCEIITQGPQAFYISMMPRAGV